MLLSYVLVAIYDFGDSAQIMLAGGPSLLVDYKCYTNAMTLIETFFMKKSFARNHSILLRYEFLYREVLLV